MVNACALVTFVWNQKGLQMENELLTQWRRDIPCIKSYSSHHCQSLSRCSVQMIPQNICAISSTCWKPQNTSLQDLTTNFRPSVEKVKPSSVLQRKMGEIKDRERSKQPLIGTSYFLRALVLTFPNIKPWHCANNWHFLLPWSSQLT